jgi:hypothetical protein
MGAGNPSKNEQANPMLFVIEKSSLLKIALQKSFE